MKQKSEFQNRSAKPACDVWDSTSISYKDHNQKNECEIS